jgi:lysophospholipase L1-like esterase
MPAERRKLLRLAGPVLGALLLSGCTEGSSLESDPAPSGPAAASLPEVRSYVALGDSFTAAPFVPSTDLAAGCFRSDANYPSLLAELLEPERFVDVSCGAATTADVTGPQATVDGRGQVPPQLRAVRRDADLVTVGIGANDEDFFAGVASTCVATDAPGLCTEEFLSRSQAVLPRTRDRVVAVLQQVQRRAPDATVVLVGYPRLADPEQPCARIPAPAERLADIATLERRLNQALRRAAGRAGAVFVDMHPASRGHEVCSSDPWVNGVRTDEEAALALHPFAAGQGAVAEEVLDVLQEEDQP